MRKKKDVWCVGSINWDEFHVRGKKYNTLGGSAANTAYHLANLFADKDYCIQLASVIGTDPIAKNILQHLAKTRIHSPWVFSIPGKSGNPKIFVDQSGERTINRVSSVLDDLDILIPQIPLEIYSNHCHVHLKSNFRVLSQIMHWNPVSLSCDISGLLSSQSWVNQIKEGKIHGNFNILFGNELEFTELLKRLDFMEPSLSLRSLPTFRQQTLLESVRKILHTEIIVIKQGSQGAILWNGRQVYSCSALKTAVTDTTGAGDAFNAGFLYQFLQKKSVIDCLKSGSIIGGLVCDIIGAQTKKITWNDIQAHWNQVHVDIL